ncbi:hypothetical protein [Polyangium jinanense]|uniref:Uncharacterized protein n=1 Tax=Polyangium jinanense TaxID=2829994 RepID=A0A9X3XAT6_9BACT|nr:hypothetical protein [Polyangium jinanense]MDC3962295.1 hypothetical protein [Polyangium jinanense]MDC3985810.1 hypothetical protein [Polyangium jinanense]
MPSSSGEQPDLPIPDPPDEPPVDYPDVPVCNADISIAADSRALMVRDPAVLARFSLDRVLNQIITLAVVQTTPEDLVKRLFDAQNPAAEGVFSDNPHCDDPDNAAFKNGAALFCPRAEGALASSPGLFEAGHPDSFEPVAIINRFDLTPTSGSNCGEHRIVYAKTSGRTDPANRVFLIFEAALPNPSGFDVITACRPVAEAWGSLATETDVETVADKLEELFFTGVQGFLPVVHPNNYGAISNENDAYGSSHGQVRVSQQMQVPWEMREYHLKRLPDGSTAFKLTFQPVTVKNNPLPELFDRANESETAVSFRSEFVDLSLWELAQKELPRVRMQTGKHFNMGESVVSGEASVDYASRAIGVAGSDFATEIQDAIAYHGLGKDCPPGDPLTPEAVLHRATSLTCAGCHAPQRFLGPERSLGCGLTFPSTLGEVHIDENGTLSEALTDVFLPRRAEVLSTYLQACDVGAIMNNLEPGNSAIPK